ncbi:hypothetical protein JYT31_00280 [Beggiatoa alba]|nr:hypothetical protein [Beggiatoa alba]
MNNIRNKYKDIINKMPESLFVKKLMIPDYEDECNNVITLSSSDIDLDKQYANLINRTKESIGRRFLPVIRVSDGEFNLLLGDQPPGPWWPIHIRIKKIIGLIKRKFINAKSFSNAAYSGDNVVNISEIESIRISAISGLRLIMKEGVLAVHLSLTNKPFQADYLLPFFATLEKDKIEINSTNIVPFYFIYPMVLSHYGDFLFENKTIMIIHSATGEKKNRIIKAVKARSASKVIWLSISHNKTFYDNLEVEKYLGKADVAFIGAGVAKLLLMEQLSILNIPVVDIGFVFEVWSNPSLSVERPFCKIT